MKVYTRVWGCLFLLALLATVGARQSVAAQRNKAILAPEQTGRQTAEGEAGVRILEENAQGLRLELEAPLPGFEPIFPTSPRELAVLGSAPGWQVEAEGLTPGADGLPVASVLIGAPPDARIELATEMIQPARLPLPGQLVQVDELVSPETGQPMRWLRCVEPTTAGPAASGEASPGGASPGDAWARLGEEALWRGQRVVRLELHPYQLDGESHTLMYAPRLQLSVRFVRPDGRPYTNATTAVREDDAWFEPMWAGTLANYTSARGWRATPGTGVLTPQPEWAAGETVYKVEVDADSIYTLSYEALLAAGLDVTHTPPLSLELVWHGQAVAVEDIGDGDARFEPGEGLRFWGQQFRGGMQDEKYTDTDVYWLRVSVSGGSRLSTREADLLGEPGELAWFTDTLRAEPSLAWWARWSATPQSYDTWFWDYVNVAKPTTKAYTLQVPFPVHTARPIVVRANTVARESEFGGFRKHHLRFTFNNTLMADVAWDGATEGPEREVSQTLDATHLISGVNSLKMTLLTDTTSIEQMFFNWFEVSYQRGFTASQGLLCFELPTSGTVHIDGLSLPGVSAYDISLPTQTVRIDLPAAGDVSFEARAGRYLVQADSLERAPKRLSRYIVPDLDPAGGADYVIVSHRAFLAQAERLAAFQSGRGLKTTVVDVDDIYNLYNAGVYHPEAIRRYLWRAYDAWPRRPAFVLLLGEGNFNFKNYSCIGCAVRDIQNEPIFIPPYLLFVDPWQGEIPSDNKFVMVNGDDPLPDMAIGRLPALSQFEATTMVDKLTGLPGSQLDDSGWRNRVVCIADNPDSGGDFWGDCDRGLSDVPNTYTKLKIYHGKSPYTSPAVTQQAITHTINAGVANVIYHGHGAVNRWGSEPLFHISDTPTLTNVQRLPVIQTYGCLDGYFFYPNHPSVLEMLLRLPSGGSIGQWSAAGLGYATQHVHLQEGFFEALFQHGAFALGQATVNGKARLWADDGMSANYIYHTHTLMGDPAMEMVSQIEMAQRASPAGDWQPGQPVTFTLVFTNAGISSPVNGVLTDVLPAGLISAQTTWSGAALTPTGSVDYAWQVGRLAYRSPAFVTITARLDSSWRQLPDMVTNTAHLSALSPGGWPLVASATLTRQVLLPDLQISQSIEPAGQIRPGDVVTFSLAFSNSGTGTASGVVVTDTPGVSVTVLSLQASRPVTPLTQARSASAQAEMGPFAWQVGDLAAGAAGTLTLAVRLPALWPDPAHVLTNTVSIGSAVWDAPAGNTQVSVRAVSAMVALRKSVEPDTALQPGQMLTYTLVYTNANAVPISHVSITDYLPAGLQVLTASGSPLVHNGQYVWTLGGLPPRQSGQVYLVARLESPWKQAGQTLTNRATMTAQSQASALSAQATKSNSVITSAVRLVYLPLVLRTAGP